MFSLNLIFKYKKSVYKGKTSAKEIQKKIQSIVDLINCPIQVLIASANDKYRKPSLELWNFFCSELNDKMEINKNDSLYCGDAAGRLKPKKDFTNSDLQFALNIGIFAC